MADYNASNYARTLASPTRFVDSDDYGGRQRILYDAYSTTGTETSNDRIFIGTLRAGHRFLGGTIVFGAMGAGRTLTLGDAEDPDRLLASTSVASAGNAQILAATGFGYKPMADKDLFLTVGGGTLSTGQEIKVFLEIGSD